MARLEVPVQLRWGDLDAYQHVNNAAMLQLLEEARIEAFWVHPDEPQPRYPTAVLEGGTGSALATFVAKQEIEYLAPLAYRRRPVIVELWLGHLGGASIEVCYEIKDEQVYARAATTIVLVEAASGRPMRIGDLQRKAWEPYVEEPLEFRRRR